MRPGPARPLGRERGFALLVVLWGLALLALLVGQVTAAGRQEATISINLRSAAVAGAAADGAVEAAVFHLLDSSAGRWRPDGTTHRLAIGSGEAAVSALDLAGRINPNTVPPEMLSVLMQVLGVERRAADALAAEIVAWRTPPSGPAETRDLAARYRAAGLALAPSGTPFETLDELGSVLGMTPALLERLRPHLSLYTLGLPRRELADPVVAATLARIGSDPNLAAAALASPTLVVQITAQARVGQGIAQRQAVAELGDTGSERPWRFLSWGE